MDSLAETLGLGEPYHIGVAVRDLVEAMPRFQDLLGLGPWGRIDAEVPAVFRGRETVSGVRSAFARLGAMYVELVEPTVGEFTAKTFLDERGEGIYHLGYWVDDIPSAIEAAGARGLAVDWAFPAAKPQVVYLDARATWGFHLEFVSPGMRAGIEAAIEQATPGG
ncbi:MAG TPA: VOC family protein [Actinomycetota bacterium]|nr:VOC family protein [Actinomycetota bacterium]